MAICAEACQRSSQESSGELGELRQTSDVTIIGLSGELGLSSILVRLSSRYCSKTSPDRRGTFVCAVWDQTVMLTWPQQSVGVS